MLISFLLTKERDQAMSETMSNSSDWIQFYQQNLSSQVTPPGRTMLGDQVSDAAVVTTATTTTAAAASAITPSPLGAGNPSSSANHLSPEGRVSKTIRRRSRASRRTPTTLLNTDTTNFRAMVQQFTGGPSAPFATGSHPGAPNFSFVLGARQPHVNPGAIMVPAGFHLQYQQLQQQQQQQQQFQHQNQQHHMFSLTNTNPGDGFLQRLGGNPRPNLEVVSDGFVMENVSSQVPHASRPSASSNENRSNTFMF